MKSKIYTQVNSLRIKTKAQDFARQILSKHTFKTGRKQKEIDFLNRSTTLKWLLFKVILHGKGTLFSPNYLGLLICLRCNILGVDIWNPHRNRNLNSI